MNIKLSWETQWPGNGGWLENATPGVGEMKLRVNHHEEHLFHLLTPWDPPGLQFSQPGDESGRDI